jgi:magnesium transporter
MTTPHSKLPLDRCVADFISTKAITLPDHYTVDESLRYLRKHPTDAPVIYFYVINEHRQLVGVLPARRLLLSPGDTPIRTQMTTTLITLRATDTLMDAMELFAMHRLLALPVLDADNRFMGLLDYSLYTDEVFDIAENRQLNEVFQLIGVRFSQAQHGHPIKGFKMRMPWLLCNIAGGLVCAAIGARFEHALAQVVIFSLFIPVILTLAESVSVQSMTLAIESTGSRTTVEARRKAIMQEAATAVMLGLVSGGIVAIVSLFWKSRFYVPIVIGGSICVAMLLAALLGRFVPSLIHRLKLNPTLASGPVTLALVDIVTITLYLTGASLAIAK